MKARKAPKVETKRPHPTHAFHVLGYSTTAARYLTTHPLTAEYATSVHVGWSQSQPRWTLVYSRSRFQGTLGGMQLDVAMAGGLAGQGGGERSHMRSRNIFLFLSQAMHVTAWVDL